jgi:hypothetical protein
VRPGLPFALEYLRTVLPGVADDQLRQFAEAAQARKAEEELEAAARAERAARRQARKAEKTATPPKPEAAAPRPAVDEEALALLNQLLAEAQRAAPSANGGSSPAAPQACDWPCQEVTPPSPNGDASGS